MMSHPKRFLSSNHKFSQFNLSAHFGYTVEVSSANSSMALPTAVRDYANTDSVVLRTAGGASTGASLDSTNAAVVNGRIDLPYQRHRLRLHSLRCRPTVHSTTATPPSPNSTPQACILPRSFNFLSSIDPIK
jgi:hypothetical protein